MKKLLCLFKSSKEESEPSSPTSPGRRMSRRNSLGGALTTGPPEETPIETGTVICLKHGNPGEMICDCDCSILCDECVDDHSGMEHRKVFINEIAKTFP
jgi:hypothetical protein